MLEIVSYLDRHHCDLCLRNIKRRKVKERGGRLREFYNNEEQGRCN